MAFDRLSHQSFCGAFVPFPLEGFIKNELLLVHHSPEPESAACNLNQNFVEVSDIAGSRLMLLQGPSDFGTEFQHPTPDGFIGNINPALEQHFLDLVQVQIEADVKPNRMGDDHRRKSVALDTVQRVGYSGWLR